MKISGRNIKYKLNKSWKGSYTVEAAVLFPIILGILVLVLYLAFYLSDLRGEGRGLQPYYRLLPSGPELERWKGPGIQGQEGI